jgi:hypothetical protein
MWIVQWEELTGTLGHARQEEAHNEAAAEAHARRLTHRGIQRVTYFEAPDLTEETP